MYKKRQKEILWPEKFSIILSCCDDYKIRALCKKCLISEESTNLTHVVTHCRRHIAMQFRKRKVFSDLMEMCKKPLLKCRPRSGDGCNIPPHKTNSVQFVQCNIPPHKTYSVQFVQCNIPPHKTNSVQFVQCNIPPHKTNSVQFVQFQMQILCAIQTFK